MSSTPRWAADHHGRASVRWWACRRIISPETTGLSLTRFVHRRRIRASLERLIDESLALSRIALDLGFSSQRHFTRLFSGLTGLTPVQYRRLQVRQQS